VEMMVGKVVKEYFAEAAAEAGQESPAGGARLLRGRPRGGRELPGAQGRDPGPGRSHRFRGARPAAVPVRGHPEEVREVFFEGRKISIEKPRTPSAWASAT